MSYDDWLTTPPESDARCPSCGGPELPFDPATPEDSGEDYGYHSSHETVACECGWVGCECELTTASEYAEDMRLSYAERG